MNLQKTIKESIEFEGIGLHNGVRVNLRLKPAEDNSGIKFKRTDIDSNKNIIEASYENVSSPILCTKIKNSQGVSISTIEHLMAAFYGEGIDNVLVEIDAPEIPIMDGSARNFVELILETGFKLSETPIKLIKINKKVEVEDGTKHISIDKTNVSLEIDFEIKFNNSFIGNQRRKINIYENDLSDIFNSRTFCLYEDIENLRNMGFAKGGSLNNAVVVKDRELLNKEGLRNNLEFVNHKILDCMGDLYLAGFKIIGSIKCSQGGHSLTNQLLRELFQDKSNFSIFEVSGKNLPTTFVNKSQLKSIA